MFKTSKRKKNINLEETLNAIFLHLQEIVKDKIINESTSRFKTAREIQVILPKNLLLSPTIYMRKNFWPLLIAVFLYTLRESESVAENIATNVSAFLCLYILSFILPGILKLGFYNVDIPAVANIGNLLLLSHEKQKEAYNKRYNLARYEIDQRKYEYYKISDIEFKKLQFRKLEQLKNQISTLSINEKEKVFQNNIMNILDECKTRRQQVDFESLAILRGIYGLKHGALECVGIAGLVMLSLIEANIQYPFERVLRKTPGALGHSYVIVNRDKKTDLNDITTWNDDCYIIDPWYGLLISGYDIKNDGTILANHPLLNPNDKYAISRFESATEVDEFYIKLLHLHKEVNGEKQMQCMHLLS